MPTLDLRQIEGENVIGRLKSVELLERLGRYRGLDRPVEQRIESSLKSLPPERHEAALLAFSTINYFPKCILDEAWKAIYWSLPRFNGRRLEKNDYNLFEIDRDQLRDSFYRANSVEGRLEDNSMFRSVPDIIDALTALETHQVNERHSAEIRSLIERKKWILLADVSLSGTSIKSEVERLSRLQVLFFSHLKIEIKCFIQLASETAIEVVERTGVSVVPGVVIPDSHALSKSNYTLLSQPAKDKVSNFVDWFAREVFRPSNAWSDSEVPLKARQYGYGELGWNVVTERNAPNNSLPIFWYKGEIGATGREYLPPFERLESRNNRSTHKRKQWLDDIEQDPERAKKLRDILIGLQL